MNNSLIILFLLICLSCHQKKKNLPSAGNTKNRITISIQPFEGSLALANTLKDSLVKRINANIVVEEEVSLPRKSFYGPRKRYLATSLLDFLSEKNTDHTRVIGVTNKDISIPKKNVLNWGVMGLGFCPGESSVISSFRVLPTSASKEQLNERMTVLALHELGHTFSLPHCPAESCIMRDAEGRMRLDYTKEFCLKCQSLLAKNRLFK